MHTHMHTHTRMHIRTHMHARTCAPAHAHTHKHGTTFLIKIHTVYQFNTMLYHRAKIPGQS